MWPICRFRPNSECNVGQRTFWAVRRETQVCRFRPNTSLPFSAKRKFAVFGQTQFAVFGQTQVSHFRSNTSWSFSARRKQGWMIRTGDILHQLSLQPLAKLKVSFNFCWKGVSVFNFCWKSVAVNNFVGKVSLLSTMVGKVSSSTWITSKQPLVERLLQHMLQCLLSQPHTRLRLQLSLESWCCHMIMMVLTISS